jgi:ferritin
VKESVLKALNAQWNAEYYSAYLYLAMSSYAETEGYKGTASWLFKQAREEMEHGTRIYEHILERGGKPSFAEIKAPETKFASLKDVFTKVLAHEKYVTGLISVIADLAVKEKDHATYGFISWFVKEQIEEEATAQDILTKFERIGDNPGLIYNLDAVLAQRG